MSGSKTTRGSVWTNLKVCQVPGGGGKGAWGHRKSKKKANLLPVKQNTPPGTKQEIRVNYLVFILLNINKLVEWHKLSAFKEIVSCRSTYYTYCT
jgi:hypothetical protein